MDGKRNSHRQRTGRTLLLIIKTNRKLQNKKELKYKLKIGKIREISLLILEKDEKIITIISRL